MTARLHNRRQGFTLVEIALAMMVATMGLLVIMGLFVGGLSAQKTSSSETQKALFADHVLNAVRGASAVSWEYIIPILHDPRTGGGLPPPMHNEWGSSAPIKVTSPSSDPQQVRFMSGGSLEIEEFAVQYRLTIEQDTSRPNIKRVRLALWDGYGPTPEEDATVYYTEVLKTY